MSPMKEVRYISRSITPPKQRSRTKSPPRARARSHSRSQDSVEANNPGNNLYITGLSTRVTNSDLEKYFNKEGKVLECQAVLDPRTRESRGFAFVTMETVEDTERCIKYLNRSVLEGRLITVERAKRSRGRTPTPGKYYGARENETVVLNDLAAARSALFIDHVIEITQTLGAEGKDPAHPIQGFHIGGVGRDRCQLPVMATIEQISIFY